MSSGGIIRVCKRDSWAVLDKYFLDDDARLSFQAKGLLAYLLAKPDNWMVYVGDLINRASDGRKAVYSMLKELEECGYLTREFDRDSRGKILGITYTIFERPQPVGNPPFAHKGDTDEPCTGKPSTQKRHTAVRNAGKETQVNTISIKNNNDQQQPEMDLDEAINDEKDVDAVVVSRQPEIEKRPVAKDGTEKKVTAAGYVNGPTHVNTAPVNPQEVRRLIDYAATKGVWLKPDYAWGYIARAGGLTEAKKKVDAGTAFIANERFHGRQIKDTVAILEHMLTCHHDSNSAWLTRDIVSEREKRIRAKEAKYADLYLS